MATARDFEGVWLFTDGPTYTAILVRSDDEVGAFTNDGRPSCWGSFNPDTDSISIPFTEGATENSYDGSFEIDDDTISWSNGTTWTRLT